MWRLEGNVGVGCTGSEIKRSSSTWARLSLLPFGSNEESRSSVMSSMAGSDGSDGMSTCCASWIRRQTREGVSSSGIGAEVVQVDFSPNSDKQ